jgi:hypothetical protein
MGHFFHIGASNFASHLGHEDRQHPPEVIPKLLRSILAGNSDFVIAKRPRSPSAERLPREAVSLVLHRSCDAGSGFRAFRREYIRQSDVGLCTCGSLILYASERGARISEIPYIASRRRVGSSKTQTSQKNEIYRKQAMFLRKRYSLDRHRARTR